MSPAWRGHVACERNMPDPRCAPLSLTRASIRRSLQHPAGGILQRTAAGLLEFHEDDAFALQEDLLDLVVFAPQTTSIAHDFTMADGWTGVASGNGMFGGEAHDGNNSKGEEGARYVVREEWSW